MLITCKCVRMTGRGHGSTFCTRSVRSKTFFRSIRLNKMAFGAGTLGIGEVVDMHWWMAVGMAVWSGDRNRCNCGCRHRGALLLRTQMIFKTVRQNIKEFYNGKDTKKRVVILLELVRNPNILSQDNVQQQQQRRRTWEEEFSRREGIRWRGNRWKNEVLSISPSAHIVCKGVDLNMWTKRAVVPNPSIPT